MAIEFSSESAVCYMCGKPYPKKKGYFPVSYAALHKGTGYVSICRTCIENLYSKYLSQCNDPKLAVRQVCRKLDLFWNGDLFDEVYKRSTRDSVISPYISKLNGTRFIGKSYDDTLAKEGTLWSFAENKAAIRKVPEGMEPSSEFDGLEESPIDDEVVAFWGTGYTPQMYEQLEQRRSYWMGKFPSDVELDLGTEAIIRQLCSLELDINRDRAAGKPIDKSVNALNTLLGSANLKPTQKRQDDSDSTANMAPLGVWIHRFEHEKPIPEKYEPSPILKYIFTWMGHLCKMLGIKGNKYATLYEQEIAKYTVNKPEYDDNEEAFLDELEESPDYGE